MKVVDRVKIHVFFVPAEEGPPNADVEVGLSDTRNMTCLHSLAITVKRKHD